MIFALFIVATIFTLCQTVRCIGNILDGYVFWKYKCFENVDDDFNSRIWGMPSWNYILKVLMRIMLIINRQVIAIYFLKTAQNNIFCKTLHFIVQSTVLCTYVFMEVFARRYSISIDEVQFILLLSMFYHVQHLIQMIPAF